MFGYKRIYYYTNTLYISYMSEKILQVSSPTLDTGLPNIDQTISDTIISGEPTYISENTVPVILPTDTPENIKKEMILQSIYINSIFYITCLICLWGLTKYTNSSFVSTVFTFGFVSWLGYTSHVISHVMDQFGINEWVHNKLHSLLNPRNTTESTVMTRLLKLAKYGMDGYEFHDKIHHDTTINKQPINILLEFSFNFWFQAGIALALKYFLNMLDNSTIIIWGLLYATVHNINYVLYPSSIHINHHVDKFTNYGIDIWDIIFDTKFKGDKIEDINHYSINLILCTLLVCWGLSSTSKYYLFGN